MNRSLAEASAEYGMSDFAESACETYLKLAGGITLKHAPTPFLVDAALLEKDWEVKGAVSEHTTKVLMKCLWLARLASSVRLRS